MYEFHLCGCKLRLFPPAVGMSPGKELIRKDFRFSRDEWRRPRGIPAPPPAASESGCSPALVAPEAGGAGRRTKRRGGGEAYHMSPKADSLTTQTSTCRHIRPHTFCKHAHTHTHSVHVIADMHECRVSSGHTPCATVSRHAHKRLSATTLLYTRDSAHTSYTPCKHTR